MFLTLVFKYIGIVFGLVLIITFIQVFMEEEKHLRTEMKKRKNKQE